MTDGAVRDGTPGGVRGGAARAASATRGRVVRRLARRVAGGADRGMSSLEVVLLAPLMIAFLLVLVAFGQQVSGRNAVNGAARDAARAGSLERSTGAAMNAAAEVAEGQLGDICVGGSVRVTRTTPAGHEPGSLFGIEVSCRVRGLDMLGVGLTSTLSGRSSSPIDPYRRSG
ncbi:TadE/TadG family type IV pilus assembly protein [Streptomyces sp. DSM 44915]|uniref:TadE/TadG family type IV pilus assembly protein n=1 Tax=Streptomyces chisholmiae TaxID=3075540 RepID=A0ABU2JT82_9ACTN|nr:TadE/TadG family type IV pilus assembly protein [Streptomyces sp. DSM 44915]MDT0267939.1 TadE/TadG family type IV pilus assembly protein [Streptomyces sp. DSM 44915]